MPPTSRSELASFTDIEWRIHVDHRLEQIEDRQKLTNRILWGIASTAGFVVFSRFVMFLLDSGALAIPQASP